MLARISVRVGLAAVLLGGSASYPAVSIITTATAAATSSQKFIASNSPIAAIWANDGGDKVTRDELRAHTGVRAVLNSVWNGSRVDIFGARNEVVAFNLVLEAPTKTAADVGVRFDKLTGPGGFVIKGDPTPTKAEAFNWLERDIELFVVRYLQIKGLSELSYGIYDERHIPKRFRRPRNEKGAFVGDWTSRPDRDKFYPDIAVPIEATPKFSVAAGTNQSVWADIYIPKNAPPGKYTGEVQVKVGPATVKVPVNLTVRQFTLPDKPSSKTMLFSNYADVTVRYTGVRWPAAGSANDKLAKKVMKRQMLVAHRHKISMIDEGAGAGAWEQTKPRPEWVPALNGKLFTAAHGYKGPGVGVGNNVYSIGTYGQWKDWWGKPTASTVQKYTNAWETWFRNNAPDTERFLYLIDESHDFAQTERWAKWMDDNPGVGRNLRSFATANLLDAQKNMPALDVVASWIAVADTSKWRAALRELLSSKEKRIYMYNGVRPASGSFATEDDGVALRQLPWGQYKKRVHRWFFWQSTYYEDFQGGRGHTNVFKTAQTFGGKPSYHKQKGMTGWNASNGDGVLFYPGMDAIYKSESLELDGPIASLRLKHWRRGIQDVDYIAMARKIDPAKTNAIVRTMVPKVLWEVGVTDPADPTYVNAPVRWSRNPNKWEAARKALADIIEKKR